MRASRPGVRDLRNRIRRLLSVTRFAPLVIRAWLGSVARRRGGNRRTRWIQSLPADCVLVQRGPADPAATIALAEGCRSSPRRVLVEWPAAANVSDEELAQFAEWHRSVILGRALPHVEVIESGAAIGAPIVAVDADGLRK